MSELEGRGADLTLFFPPEPSRERATSDEGLPPEAARQAGRHLKASRKRAGDRA